MGFKYCSTKNSLHDDHLSDQLSSIELYQY